MLLFFLFYIPVRSVHSQELAYLHFLEFRCGCGEPHATALKTNPLQAVRAVRVPTRRLLRVFFNFRLLACLCCG